MYNMLGKENSQSARIWRAENKIWFDIILEIYMNASTICTYMVTYNSKNSSTNILSSIVAR